MLDKRYIKKENRGEEIHEEEIGNDIKGLYNYFTAANIRDKVININQDIFIYFIIKSV
jgi:hypothetical protein